MIGQTVSHYKVLEKLGEGGMGIVYKAQDVKLDRLVALKFLPQNITPTEAEKTRFIHEAKAASALDHPNICTVYEIDETPDGQLFIVMALYEGIPLNKKIEQGPLKIEEAIETAIQAAEGLRAAHEKGIIHRDIKSGNLILTEKGQVKLMDFGLAKRGDLTMLTKTGATLGTVPYMSPEQARGEKVDQRTDIWSLGVVLYELITGRLPFRSDYADAVVYSILNEQQDPLTAVRTDVPAELERIVNKLLAKDAALRYQHVDDLLADLRGERKKLEYEWAGHTTSSRDVGGTAGQRRFAKTAIMIAALIVALLAIYLFYPQSPTIPANSKSIAVLPFKNFSDSKEDEYFADGVTEDIITQLSKIADLKVISRTSVMRFKGGSTSVREIGRELNVGAVLEGSIRRAGNQIRIVAQLIDANNEGHLWAETYDKELTQIFAIQSDVAQNIASALKTKLVPEESARIGQKHTVNTEAYQDYLKGRFYWNKRTGADVQTAIEHFQKAIAVDTSFALAYTGLASAYANLPQFGFQAKKYWPLAIASASKGLELDSTSAEAHAVLGLYKYNYEWDWAGAESQLKQAIALNPGYATAHQWYSAYFAIVGRMDDAIKEIKIAQELDPLSLVINTNVAASFYVLRQYDKAVEGYKKTLELDSNYVPARVMLGLVFGRQNRFDEAIVVLTKVRHIVGDAPAGLPELGQVYARAGKKKEALETLDALLNFSKHGYSVSRGIASVYCALGDKDKTFQWLERARQDREPRLVIAKGEPIWDEIRSDPRFLDLMKKMGLEK